MEASEPQPPIHNSIELVLSSHTLNRRHSRRYTSSGSIRSMRSLSLYVYCPNGHIMKPITKGDYPISPSVKVNHSGDAITTEEVSDIENQIFPPSCHGSKHNQDNGPDFPAVEYHCSVCQYYLCENCYTDELKRLNNIPVHRSTSTGRESDSENTNISPRDVDVESRHVLPTESGDTEEKNSLRGERHVETMSVQVEVDNFSVKSVTDVASVHNSEYLLSKVGNSNVHVSSEDALSDQDIDSLSMNPFKLVPMQLNSTPRKLSVSGLTYSSIDSDSLRDDDSMSHFRVEGRNILTEQPTMEDDDNMTSISTIHSDTMDVTSRSVYVPKKGLTSNDLNRRRFTLSHEDTPSISGHGLVDLNSSQHSENSDHDDDHDDDDDDVDADLHGTHVDDSSRENIKEEYSQILLLSNKIDGEESISDSGIDNDDENMSIGSIDSTKCYPNNLYHSKGFLTIASLHKTDSPSGYLTHHLSALPTSTLRYTNNNFRRTTTKAPSPSQSHIHSPVIEEEELILHTSSNLSHMNSPTIQTDEIHCAIEETHEEDERSREQQQLASL